MEGRHCPVNGGKPGRLMDRSLTFSWLAPHLPPPLAQPPAPP